MEIGSDIKKVFFLKIKHSKSYFMMVTFVIKKSSKAIFIVNKQANSMHFAFSSICFALTMNSM